jgi:hypothetical protein
VAAAAVTGTGGSSKKRAYIVINKIGHSRQLQRAAYYELSSAVEVIAGPNICPRRETEVSLHRYK